MHHATDEERDAVRTDVHVRHVEPDELVAHRRIDLDRQRGEHLCIGRIAVAIGIGPDVERHAPSDRQFAHLHVHMGDQARSVLHGEVLEPPGVRAVGEGGRVPDPSIPAIVVPPIGRGNRQLALVRDPVALAVEARPGRDVALVGNEVVVAIVARSVEEVRCVRDAVAVAVRPRRVEQSIGRQESATDPQFVDRTSQELVVGPTGVLMATDTEGPRVQDRHRHEEPRLVEGHGLERPVDPEAERLVLQVVRDADEVPVQVRDLERAHDGGRDAVVAVDEGELPPRRSRRSRLDEESVVQFTVRGRKRFLHAEPLPLVRAAAVADVVEPHPRLDGEAAMAEGQLPGRILDGELAAAGRVEPAEVQRMVVREIVLGHDADRNVHGPGGPVVQRAVQAMRSRIEHDRAARLLEAPVAFGMGGRTDAEARRGHGGTDDDAACSLRVHPGSPGHGTMGRMRARSPSTPS